jgi:hypothetical protein
MFLPMTSAIGSVVVTALDAAATYHGKRTGRSSAKLRRSPLTEYWRLGNVTCVGEPARRISFVIGYGLDRLHAVWRVPGVPGPHLIRPITLTGGRQCGLSTTRAEKEALFSEQR